MSTLLKLASLYKIIQQATNEEISLLLGYAENLAKSRGN